MEDYASACQTCLDLNYDLFEELSGNFSYPLNPSNSLHYHISSLNRLSASAQRGCRYCSILYQGISLFWGEAGNNEVEDNEVEGDNEVGGDNDEQADKESVEEEEEQEDEYEDIKERGYENSDDDDSNEDEKPYSIFIEIEPGKPLAVLRTKYPQNSPYSEVHTRLEFYTKTNCIPIHPAFHCSVEVPSYLDLTSCTRLVNSWLQQCTRRHAACMAPLSKLPKRLVSVSREIPQLIETKALAYSKYVTLSHCWGNSVDMIKTTKGNLTHRKAGIDWEELPQIFKDAIALTRSIDCQWIWIDSLCIIQDDEIDWEEESIKMAEIYSNSFLNIAATFSPTSFGSCFSSRRCPGDHADNYKDWAVEAVELVEYSNDKNAGLQVRVSQSLGHDYIVHHVRRGRDETAPLLGRAWAFQERILAPRTLHFCTSELIWECNTTLACECTELATVCPRRELHNTRDSLFCKDGTTKTKPNRSAEGLKMKFADVCQNRASKKEILDFWLETVSTYSSLSLTKVSDRPYALSGIASRIFDSMKSDYLAGLWAVDLPRALLWTLVPRSNPRAERISPTAPTWSWMSQYDPIRMTCSVTYCTVTQEFTQDDRCHVHESDTFCYSGDGSPFGNVVFGHVEISAAVLYGKISQTDDRVDFLRMENSPSRLTLYADCPTAEVFNNDEVLCLLIGTRKLFSIHENRECVLVLKAQSGTANYKRIGVVESPLTNGSPFNHARIERVKII